MKYKVCIRDTIEYELEVDMGEDPHERDDVIDKGLYLYQEESHGIEVDSGPARVVSTTRLKP